MIFSENVSLHAFGALNEICKSRLTQQRHSKPTLFDAKVAGHAQFRVEDAGLLSKDKMLGDGFLDGLGADASEDISDEEDRNRA